MEKTTKDQFLSRLVREYFVGGSGVTIWEGNANEKMGPHKREAYTLNGHKIIHYVGDPDNRFFYGFHREMVLEKPVFEGLLRDLNGKSGPSDYVVLCSLLKSQELADSREVSAIDRFLSLFSPQKRKEHSRKLNYLIGRPEDYKPKDIKCNKRLSF